MTKKKRGIPPKQYSCHGSLMTVKRFAEILKIPMNTAYWHLQKCGGDMEAAWVRAERTRTRQAELKIGRIITGGGA